ncbi:hypothetical protein BKA80DRAFT_126396 [Phyllosticta citrichinensis]
MNRAKYRWTCVRASYGEGMLTDSRRMVVVSCFERSFTRLCFCILGAICSSYRSRRTDRGKDGTLLTFCKVSSSSSLTKYLRTSTTVLPTPTPTPTETETNPLVPTNHQRPSRAAAWSRATARQTRCVGPRQGQDVAHVAGRRTVSLLFCFVSSCLVLSHGLDGTKTTEKRRKRCIHPIPHTEEAEEEDSMEEPGKENTNGRQKQTDGRETEEGQRKAAHRTPGRWDGVRKLNV